MATKPITSLTLRDKQKTIVQQILNLNRPVDEGKQTSLDWKVLIYDKRGFEILYTLINLDKLYEVGVTFVCDITKKREHIEDVSAVYFVEPTLDNFQRIAQDCEAALYDTVYINFIYGVENDLQKFAEAVGSKSDGRCIQSVFDQYIDFSSTDSGLVELFQNRSLLLPIYGLHTTDNVAMGAIDDYATALLSVFVTAGEIPRIYYADSATEMVAQKLDALIQPKKHLTNLWDRCKSSTSRSENQPVLILIDRRTDFASILHHSSGYQAIIHDIYHIDQNSVSVDGKRYLLDPDHDLFWITNRTNTLDDVNANIGKFGNEFNEAIKTIGADVDKSLNNFPSMRRDQISLDTHTNLATGIMRKIKTSQYQNVYKLEQSCFLNENVSVNDLITTLQPVQDKNEKLRTAAIAYMCNKIPDAELPRVASELALNVDFFAHLTKLQRAGKGIVQRLIQSKTAEVCTVLPIVQTTKRLLDNEATNFQVLNGRPVDSRQFGNIYVFVVGPGSYVEYQGLMMLAKSKDVSITYGCTSMITPSKYVEELRHIAD